MPKFSVLIALGAILVLTFLLVGQALAEESTTPTKLVVILPQHFRGWGCVTFGVAGAPPLAREGDALIVRPQQGEVVQTSDKPNSFFGHAAVWVETDGARRLLPYDHVHREIFGSDSGNPVQRYCAFYGTVDESELAGDPPGFPKYPRENTGVSDQERRALIAIYNATDGDRWNHHVGWLGPPGTECEWHGVECQSETHVKRKEVTGLTLMQNNLAGAVPDSLGQLTHLTELDLMENNLVGSIPRSLGQLNNLTELSLVGNHLFGQLPQPLLQHWLAGTLRVASEASLLTDISKIEYEVDPSANLCGFRRIELDADGRAIRYETRCREATPDDRTTYCEVKEGKSWGSSFATLAWVLEKNGFFHLNTKYSGNMTDAAFVTTRATRSGKLYSVEEYAFGAPFELGVIHLAIDGFSSSRVEWEKSSTRPECPASLVQEK